MQENLFHEVSYGIEKEEHTLMSDMAKGQSQDLQIQNVLFNKTGKLISRSTICQITKIQKGQLLKVMILMTCLKEERERTSIRLSI